MKVTKSPFSENCAFQNIEWVQAMRDMRNAISCLSYMGAYAKISKLSIILLPWEPLFKKRVFGLLKCAGY